MAIPPPPRPQNRGNMIKNLNIDWGNKSSSAPLAGYVAPEKKGGGIFDIPVLGQIIDAVDTPRAMIVSGIKEIGDIFDDDNSFSIGDWYKQSRDNIMMGEVLRDWDVDLPGPLDFAVGLGLDIALDPLTYMAGAGLLARGAKAADVANGLRKAAKAAEAAGDAAKAAGMLKAAQRVDRTKSVLSAGKYLDEVGISSGARFTIPGTGKIGRTIIEKPLRKIFPVVGRKLDDMRVRQLYTETAAGPGGMFRWGDEADRALDLTNPNNQKLVRNRVRQLRGEGPAVAVKQGSEADKAARLAMKMAVEMPGSAQMLAKIPGSTAFVAWTASAPGKAFAASSDTKLGQTFGKAFSTNVNINQMIRSSNIEEQVTGRWVQRVGSQANTRSSAFAATAKQGAENLKRAADDAEIDFDELMLAAENEVPYLVSQGNDFGLSPKHVALRAQAREYLDSLRTMVNEALPYSDDLDGVVGELYLMRYIGKEGAEKLDELGRLSGKPLPKGVAADDLIQGNSFHRRNWITPKGMKDLIRENLKPGVKPDISIEKLIDDLGVDPSLTGDALEDALLKAIDDAADDGFRVTGTDGHVYTNKTHVGTLKDIKAGSIRDQLSRMGKEAHGSEWVDIFDTDMTKALTSYIDSHSRYIRSQYVVDGLAQRGIIVRGANGQLTRAAANRLTSSMNRAGKKLSNAQILKDRLEATKTARDEKIAFYTGEAGKAGSKTSQRAATKAALEVARLEGELRAISSVMEAIANGSGIEGLTNDALALIQPGAQFDLRRGVGYISQKVKQTSEEVARLHNARNDAVELIHSLDEQIAQVEEMLKRIEAVNNIDPELQGFLPLFDGYKEIQDSVNIMREGLRAYKSTFINRMLDDVTVRAADDLEDFLNGMTGDGLFDFAKNGKRLISAARKDERGRISRRLGQIFKGNPKWEKWLEEMPELADLKNAIENLDEGDMGILARLERYRQIKGADALIDGKSPIGNNIAELLSDIGGAERRLLNAKLREIEEILTLGLNKRPDRGVPFAKQTAGQVSDEATEALQETFDLLGAKFEELEVAMSSAQKKLLETEAYLAERRTYWRGKKQLTESELSEVSATMVQQQRIIDELKLEKMRLMDSDRTTVRMSAADSQQAAVKELRKVRNLHNLSDVYGGRLNDYMVNMSGLGNAQDVSNRTNNLLRGYSLVGGAGEGSVELFSAAVQAAARTADVKAMSDFMKKYSTIVNWWKAQAVATPGFIMRNMMGGMWINNQIADVPMSMHTRVLGIRRAAAKAAEEGGRKGDIAYGLEQLIANGKPVGLKKWGIPQAQSAVDVGELETFLTWYRTGMASSGQVSQEVRSSLDAIGGGSMTLNPFKAEFAPFAQVRKWNQEAEFMLRGSVAHHTAMTGGSIDDAFELVNKYHFDYANLTQTERRMKQVIPFWTWQKNILPVLVESIGKKPTAWGRLQQIKGELELHSPEEGLVPSWFGENMGIRLPFNIGGNRAYAIPDLPFRDLAKWSKAIEGREPWRPLAESVFPMYKLPIELAFGKKYFGNIPFTGRYQQSPSYGKIPGLMPALGAFGFAKKNRKGEWKTTDQTLYVLDQFMPVLNRVRRLLPNEAPKQERAITTWLSVFLGTNIRPNTPSTKRSELIRMQKELAEELRDKKDIEFRRV